MTEYEMKYNVSIFRDGSSGSPLEAEVNQELGNPWNANFKMDIGSPLDLGVGNTIRIRIDQDSNQHSVFTGVIEKKTRVYPEQLGPPYIDYETKCRSGVIMQNSYVQKEVPSGQATFQIYQIVHDLIPGTIAAFSYNPAHASPDLPMISGKMNNYWDLVKDVCDKADWDFYIDQGSTLRAFPRGTSVSPLVITTSDYLLQLNLEEDASDIINYQEIVGGEYGRLSDILINTLNWSSNGLVSTLTTHNRLCVKGSISTGVLYLKYTFPSVENFLRSTNLLLGIEYFSTKKSEGPLIIKYYLYSDASNYFYKEDSYSGGKMKAKTYYWDLIVGMIPIQEGYYFDPWKDEKIGLLFMDPNWSIVGSPKWGSISAFEVRVLSPSENDNQLWVSALTITTLVSGIYQSNTAPTWSQNSFGVRKGKSIIDSNYTSAEMCLIGAGLVVEAFKSPLLSAGEVPTAYNFDYNLGEKATLDLLGNTIVYEVRNIKHDYSDNRLKTYLGLETKQRYTIEDILDFYKKSLSVVSWNLEAWKLKAVETGLIDTRTGLIDWSNVDDMFPSYEWIDMKNVIGLAEGLDGYTFRTGDTAGYASVSAGGRYDLVFGGDDLHGFMASRKKTVPWNKDLMLKFELKYPATIVGVLPVRLRMGVDSWDVGDAACSFFFRSGTLYFTAGTFAPYEYIESSLNLGVYTPGEIHRLEWRYYRNTPIFYIFKDEIYQGSLTPTYWNTITHARPLSFYCQTDNTTLEVYSYKLAQPWG
uniref:Tail protein n=1 Tax=viral metagenome TaxID=1070528 RepID=A0A6H1ZLA9_9ZZZZ